MDRQEILNMKPGRELDILITEIIFNYQNYQLEEEYGILYKENNRESWGNSPEYTISKVKNYQRQGINCELLKRKLINKDYSNNILFAWEVVEKMVAKMTRQTQFNFEPFEIKEFKWTGPLFKPEYEYLTNEGYPLGTTCWFVSLDVNGMHFVICGDTAPEAICKAALIGQIYY